MSSKQRNPNNSFSIAVLGSGEVGKSCCTIRFLYNKFDTTHLSTIEDTFENISNIDKETAFITIIDTSGQDDYSVLRDQYYRTCDGFLFVFDITNPSSLKEIVKMYEELKMIHPRKTNIPCIFFANKMDLINDSINSNYQQSLDDFLDNIDYNSKVNIGRKIVTREIVEDALKKCDDVFLLSGSALQGTNVEEAFFNIVRQVRNERLEIEKKVQQAKKFQKTHIISQKKGISDSSKSQMQDDIEFFSTK